jgi:hypothetical protein
VVVVSDGVAASAGGTVGVGAGLVQAKSNPIIKKTAIVKHILALRDKYMVLISP